MVISKKDHALLVNAIRRGFSRSSLRREALNKSVSKEKGPRGGKQYVCSSCGKSFGLRYVDVDHIRPVVPFNRTAYEMRIETYIKRVWCGTGNLQVLCKLCHKKKTNKERGKRAAAKKKRGK